MWSKASAWLKSHRRLALALSAAFLIFELSRAVPIWQALFPDFGPEAAGYFERLEGRKTWVVVRNMAMAAVFFTAFMAAAVYVLLRIRRALSRYWTSVKPQG